MNRVNPPVLVSEMERAVSTRGNVCWILGASVPFAKVEDKSRTDEHLEEHDKWDAHVGVKLLKKGVRTTPKSERL